MIDPAQQAAMDQIEAAKVLGVAVSVSHLKQSFVSAGLSDTEAFELAAIWYQGNVEAAKELTVWQAMKGDYDEDLD